MSRASFKTYGILSKNLHGAVSCFHLAVTNLGIYLRLVNKGFMVLDTHRIWPRMKMLHETQRLRKDMSKNSSRHSWYIYEFRTYQ